MDGRADSILDSFRRRIAAALFASAFVRALAVSMAALAVAAFAFRAFAPGSTARAAFSVCGALAALLVPCAAGAIAARRRLPSREACLARIDEASDADGLIMAGAAESGWQVPKASAPRVSWRPPAAVAAAAAVSTAAAIFALAAPERWFSRIIAPPTEFEVSEQVEERREAAKALAEADPSLVSQVEALTNELARIEANASADDAARTLSALDHLSEMLERLEKESALRAEDALAAMQAAEAIASRLAEALSEIDPGEAGGAALSSEAASALADALSALDLPASLMDSDMPPALSNFLASALSSAASGSETNLSQSLTREQVEALRELLRNHSVEQAERLSKLCENGSYDPAKLASMCKGGSCTNAAACAAALQEMLASGGQALADALQALPMPGGGSPQHGYAPPLDVVFGYPADTSGVQPLDTPMPGFAPPPDDLFLVDRVAVAPDVSDSAAPVSPGGLAAEAAPAAGSGADATLLPRHKAAVGAYFSEDGKHERSTDP